MSTRPPRERFWVTLAVGLWCVVLVAGLGRVALMDLPRHCGIYHVYQNAAADWLAGRSVYADDDGIVFRYAPLWADGVAVLGLMPGWLGNLLLRSVNFAVFSWGIWMWGRNSLPFEMTRTRWAWTWLLVLPLAVSSLVDVQFNAIMAGLLFGAVGAVACKRWNVAAMALVLAVSLKLFPIALAGLLILLYPRKLLWRFAVACFIVAAVPFLLQTPGHVYEEYGRWFQLVGRNDRQSRDINVWYRDLWLFLRQLGVFVPARVQLAVEVVGGVVAAVTCVVYQRLGARENVVLQVVLGVTCAWMLVLGPATEQTTYVLLSATVAWVSMQALADGGLTGVLSVPMFWFFVSTQAALWTPWGKDYHNLGVHTVATGFLLVIMGLVMRNELRRVRLARAA